MDNINHAKKCFKCGQLKPLFEFYKHPGMRDGRLNKCKECNKKDVTENRLKNVEHYREYDLIRAKIIERKTSAQKISNNWRKKDPKISNCINEITKAKRSGLLKKQPCTICGSEKSLAHHESYNRPLDVTWLCQPHHKARHKKMKIDGIDPLKN